jgi:hypothetical protein
MELVIAHLISMNVTDSSIGVVGMRGSSERTTIIVATLALILLVILAPFMVFYQDVSDSTRYLVSAFTWSFINQSGETAFILPHHNAIPFSLLFASPHFFFVLVINRTLRDKSQSGEFFLASALVVLQLLAPCAFFYFNPFHIELPGVGGPIIFRPAPPVGSFICVPAPILLCVGLLVLGLWETKRTTLESES